MEELLIKPKEKSRVAYYMREEEVPASNIGKVLLYSVPTSILNYDSIKKHNHEAYSKMDLVQNLMFRINQLENMKRDFANEQVKFQMLVERCVNDGIDVKITPDEIESYHATLGEIMKKDINDMVSEIPGSIRSEVLNKVRQVIAEVDIEYRNSFKFNVIRINNLLAINDLLISDLTKAGSRSISLKDKVGAINGLEKSTKNLIEQLIDVFAVMGKKPDDEKESKEESSKTEEEKSQGRFSGLVKTRVKKDDE